MFNFVTNKKFIPSLLGHFGRAGYQIFEHIVRRPFLGAVLTTAEQRRWCQRHGYSQFGLTSYSAVESLALAILLPGLVLLLGAEINWGLPGWAAALLNLSKDGALWTGIILKGISMLDSVSRMTLERFVYPRRPRQGLFAGILRRIFYDYPQVIIRSRIFARLFAKGQTFELFGRWFLRRKNRYAVRFNSLAGPSLESVPIKKSNRQIHK